MEFLKMQGLGNDFVLFEGPSPSLDQVRRWCDRRTAIGADGVLRVSETDHPAAVARMEYWNADGSAAGMCGNGLRCVARYVYEHGWAGDRSFTIETATGLNRAEVLEGGMVRVELGAYRIGADLVVEDRSYTAAEVGNPNAVTFLGDPAELESSLLDRIGPFLQEHPAFPSGANVELAVPVDGGFRVRVWERGIGETRACGTGAAAVAAIAHDQGRAGPWVEIELRGGVLGVELVDGVVWIRGPAVEAFSGTLSG